jgi:ElaB/YqjD/DUF883 family membrane-anchored ribosome-binding protein
MSDTQFESNMRGAVRQGEAAARRAIDEASDAMPTFADAARATGDALRVAGRKAASVMADLTEEARDTGAKTRDQVSSRVQAQPMTSIVVAAALGLVAGLLMSRQ